MTQRPALPRHTPRPAGAPLALDAVKVLDFTHFVAGPLCTQILGDLGADVIKVERPGRGDDYRGGQPQLGGDAACFLGVNRNKQSVALDLSSPEGRRVALELAAQADVLVENFSHGVMRRLGLDWDTLSKLNPRLVYCSITGWGREGELAQRPSFDPIAQAESGFISLSGPAEGTGVVCAAPVMDMTTGMMASNMVLAALYAREKLGRGQQLHIAMLDQAVNLLGFRAMNYLATGQVAPRSGNSSRQTMPVGAYRTQDREIYLCCANDRTYRRLALDVLGRPDLVESPEFATNQARLDNVVKFNALVNAILATDTAANWLVKMRAAGVPVAPIRTLDEALNSDEVRSRGVLSGIAHPVAGEVPNVAPPFEMSLTPVADPVAAPTVGQHTDAALRRLLGYGDAQLRALRQAGTIG